MKKILSIIFIITFVFASISMADSITATSLGNPTMLLNDTSIISTYPGALQMFPNAIWANISKTNTSGISTYSLGVAYVANDMIGLLVNYIDADVTNSYPNPTNGPYQILLNQHIVMAYGAKLGNLYVGAMMVNSLADTNFSTKTIDSNTKEVRTATNWSGLKTSLKPSAVLDMDQLKVYGTLNLDLNATKYSMFSNHKTNEVTVTPDLLESVGVSALAAYELNDKTTAGLSLKLSSDNMGYNVKAETNMGTTAYDSNYIDSSFDASAVLGFSIAANDTVTLFFDLPFGMKITPTAYWKGSSQMNDTTTTLYTLPTPKMGAQFQIIKNVKFRVSATPTWTRTVVAPSDYDKITPTGTKKVSDAYDLATDLGLGVKLGQFYINGIVNANTFTDAFQKPASLLGGIITSASGAVTILTSLQINYVF